jgi:hypothetical protein
LAWEWKVAASIPIVQKKAASRWFWYK